MQELQENFWGLVLSSIGTNGIQFVYTIENYFAIKF